MKKVLTFLLIFFLSFCTTYGGYQDILEKKYSSFIQNLERKYENTQLITVLKKLSSVLDKSASKKTLSETKKSYLRFLHRLNQEKIGELSLSQKNQLSNRSEQKQKELASVIVLKSQIEERAIPEYIVSLQNTGKRLYITNSNYEFIEGNTGVKKVIFSKAFSIDAKNFHAFDSMDGIILSSGESNFLFLSNFTMDEKVFFSSLDNHPIFGKQFFNDKKGYSIDNNQYISYLYTEYKIFQSIDGFYTSDIKNNGVTIANIIFLLSRDGKYGYIEKPNRVTLSDIKIVTNILNKEAFLSTLVDDMRQFSSDSGTSMDQLILLTHGLIDGAKDDDEKVKRIYTWIVNNISYVQNFDIKDTKIFSGIETFKNRTGVCDGYAKLMIYMLSIAGVQDIEHLQGDVIDAQDFPNIGHAWVRIGDRYYDPTFDDPLGLESSLKPEDYRFYQLPRDIFYTNRYNYKDTPVGIKGLTLEERKTMIIENIWSLLEKYQDNSFLILQPYTFRKKYGIAQDDTITMEYISNIIPRLSHQELNGKMYYIIDSVQDIENILSLKHYNLNALYLQEGKNNRIYDFNLK